MIELWVGEVKRQLLEGWSITTKRGHRSNFRCTIYLDSNVDLGDRVILTQDYVTIYAGVVRKLRRYDAFETKHVIYLDIESDDYSVMLFKRRVAATIDNLSAEDAISTYIEPILIEEGLTLGVVDADFLITRDVWRYYRVSDCLDRLADLQQGFYWFVDLDKKLHFLNESAITPVVLSEKDDNFTEYVEELSMESYRNVQYAIVPKTRTATQYNEICSQTGNDNRVYTTRFPIAEKPTSLEYTLDSTASPITWVTVDLADFGVNGFDSNRKWYWSFDSTDITQSDTETILPNPNGAIRVTYVGLRNTVLKVSNEAQINDRLAKEPGTSGIYEDLLEVPNIDDYITAASYTRAVLNKYSEVCNRITFTTRDNKFLNCYKIKCELPSYFNNASFIVESVSISQVGYNMLEYRINAVDAASLGEWEKFFTEHFKNLRKYTLNENDILTVISGIGEVIEIEGYYTIKTNKGLQLPFILPSKFDSSEYY